MKQFWWIRFIVLYVAVNGYTFYLIWTKSLLGKPRKTINTLLCILLPFAWNIIILSAMRRKDKGLEVMTRQKRKLNKGTNGSSLTDYTLYSGGDTSGDSMSSD